jgi:protein-disulfide isomerase/uncharacterized membrane protein
MDGQRESIRPRPASGRDKRVIALVVLALIGAWISLNLTRYSMPGGQGGSAVFRTVCEMTGGGCDQVLKSPWSMLPRGIPTALVGLVYFSAIAFWYLLAGRPNRAGRAWFMPIFVLQVLGALFSLFLLGVMLLQLGSVCGWCAVTHVLNFILLGLAWKLWPRGPRMSDMSGEAAWPPARLGLALLLLIVAMGAFWERWLTVHYLFAEAAQFRNDTDLMRYLHVRNPPLPIPLRAGDPMRGNAAAPHTIVVFSDFQCPACLRFAGFYKTELQPLYGDRLRLVYKHLPLDSECNPQMPKAFHPNACEAAHAAEAARELGGTEAFWKMHDVLFERQADVAEGRWADLAASAGLDGAAVAERVAQKKHIDRISEDVQRAMDAKVKGTPGIFIDGRPLPEWNRIELWKAILGDPASPPAVIPVEAPVDAPVETSSAVR